MCISTHPSAYPLPQSGLSHDLAGRAPEAAPPPPRRVAPCIVNAPKPGGGVILTMFVLTAQVHELEPRRRPSYFQVRPPRLHFALRHMHMHHIARALSLSCAAPRMCGTLTS